MWSSTPIQSADGWTTLRENSYFLLQREGSAFSVFSSNLYRIILRGSDDHLRVFQGEKEECERRWSWIEESLIAKLKVSEKQEVIDYLKLKFAMLSKASAADDKNSHFRQLFSLPDEVLLSSTIHPLQT